ncbi:Ankyrin repeat and KH domain-containing protein mask [Symbiodinium microadriaticum]|uniref:Ankyrin repeat and KH domain-containing protein mask n=1 Tax=Symbiodinium microadriaticum TaxID=2951 RepID=A0A1Q9D3K6_SYMMI|nr:Ankyrin repeat and KH domain-containing protein mask [Symbiodinium microadriaticum]
MPTTVFPTGYCNGWMSHLRPVLSVRSPLDAGSHHYTWHTGMPFKCECGLPSSVIQKPRWTMFRPKTELPCAVHGKACSTCREVKRQAPQKANSNGETPLLCAVQKGRANIVKLLLGHSAAVDISNNDGETPLNLAAGKGDTETVQLLLVDGRSQSVDTPDRLGWTPVLMAAHGGHVGVLRLLLKSNAKPADSHSGTGETPLLCAAKRGHVEVAKLLLTSAEVPMIDMADRDGNTPLMMAAQFGFAEALRLLLSKKASIDLCNKANETALLLAAQEGFAEVVAILLEEGSKAVNIAAADGY